MYTEKRYNKKGELISIRIFCSGKDPESGKYKNYPYTWKIPKGLSKKQIEIDLGVEIKKWSERVQRALDNGYKPSPKNIDFEGYTFVQYAKKWLEVHKNEFKLSYILSLIHI